MTPVVKNANQTKTSLQDHQEAFELLEARLIALNAAFEAARTGQADAVFASFISEAEGLSKAVYPFSKE